MEGLQERVEGFETFIVREDLDRLLGRQAHAALQDPHLGVLVVLDQRDRPAVAAGASR